EWALVLYAGGPRWHQRRIWGHLAPPQAGQSDADFYLISTPDHDVYEEDYGRDSQDVLAIRFTDGRRDLAGLDANQVYRFRRALTPAQTAAIRVALDQVGDETYLARERAAGRPGVLPASGSWEAFDFTLAAAPGPRAAAAAGGHGAGGGAPAAAGLAGVAPARGPGLGGGLGAEAAAGAAAAPPAGAAPAAGQQGADGVAALFAPPPAPEWIMVETTSAGARGTVVQLNGSERLGGDVGVMRVAEGWICIRQVSINLALYASAESGHDCRLLGLPLQADGHRERLQFRDAVARFTESGLVGWPLEGPRTVGWCCVFIDRRRGGPLEHFHQFKSYYHLTNDDYGITHYESIMRMIEFLACWDHVAMRQAQLYEYIYAVESEGSAAGAAGPGEGEKDGKKSKGRGGGRGRGLSRFAFLDEASVFTGTSKEDGRMMVCPSLLHHVAAMVERDAGILKALRKAKEERRALSGA
ncbi:unnamed protein product, partial [Prorocentrum cordatum]